MERRIVIAVFVVAIAVSGGLGYYYLTWTAPIHEVRTTTISTTSDVSESRTTSEVTGVNLETLSVVEFLSYLSTVNRTWAIEVNETRLCIEDGELNSLERKFLLSPTEYSEQLKSYYLSELEKAFPKLAGDLGDIPHVRMGGVKVVEAVEDITYLALLSSNTNVRNTFDLMVEYGKPNPSSYGYEVGKWNAKLLALLQLAEDEEFQKDDLVALSIAAVDGVYRVIGDDDVQNQVRKDDRDMLRLARDLVDWQRERGMALLSDLPSEAALYWAWRGTTTMDRGGYWAFGGGPYPLQTFMTEKMPLNAYLWDTIDPNTLREMRADAEGLGWCKDTDIDAIVAKLEDYYYGYAWRKGTGHWEYHYVTSSGESDTIKHVDGVDVEYGEVQNTDWQYYQRFKKGLPGVGCCVAETALVDAWLKSLGISCNSIVRYPEQGGYVGHNHAIYYNPGLAVWKAYDKQIELGLTNHPTDIQVFQLRKSPIDYRFDSYYTMYVNLTQIRSMFVNEGVPSDKMREWILPVA